ncbi:MAG: hypothetical protein V3W10_08680, partial [candidate division NC10 bacterium]
LLLSNDVKHADYDSTHGDYKNDGMEPKLRQIDGIALHEIHLEAPVGSSAKLRAMSAHPKFR